MPWRIYRYIIKEIIPYFVLTFLIATAIIFSQEVGRFAELFVKRNVPPVLVRTLLISLLTRISIITLPVSLLTGIFLALARLSSDNEVLSLLASGMSRRQLLIPLMLISGAVSSLLGFITLKELPDSAAQFRRIRGELLVQGIRTQVRPRVFDTRFLHRVLYIREIDRRTDVWKGVFIASTEGGDLVLMTGERGVLVLGEEPSSSQLHLFNGVVHRLERNEDGELVYHLEAFSSHHVRFDPRSSEAEKFKVEFKQKPPAVTERPLRELLRIPPERETLYVKARVEAGRRLAIPLACLLFAPLGLALGIVPRAAGRSAGFIVSIILATIYYLLLFAGEHLARARLVPPFSAMWLADAVFAGIGLIGMRERPIFGGWQHLLAEAAQRTTALLHRVRRPREREDAMIKVTVRKSKTGWILPVRLIDRYLAGGFLRYFGLAMFALWLIFMVFTLFELAPDIIKHGIGARYVAEYFAFLSPQVLQALSPPCALIASLLVMSILTQRNEVLALKASGISTYRISLPVLALCAILVGLMTAWATWVVPPANQRQDRLRFYIKKGRFPQPIELSPMPFIGGHWMYGLQARIFHFDAFDPTYDEFRNLLILDIDESNMSIRRRIEAPKARWNDEQGRWILDSARVWTFSGSEMISGETRKVYPLALEETPAYFKKYVKKPAYMSASALAAHIRELARQGVDVTELRVARQRKLALAWACLAMGLVGVPFGFSAGRRGALFGASVAVVLGVIYWVGWGFFAQLGRYGYVGVGLAGWGPVGLLAAIGVYGLFRVRT